MSSGRTNVISCGEFGRIEFVHTARNPENLATLGQTLVQTLEAKYSLTVRVSEPLKVSTGVDTWKPAVLTLPGRRDLPPQRIHVDVCAIPSHDRRPPASECRPPIFPHCGKKVSTLWKKSRIFFHSMDKISSTFPHCGKNFRPAVSAVRRTWHLYPKPPTHPAHSGQPITP